MSRVSGMLQIGCGLMVMPHCWLSLACIQSFGAKGRPDKNGEYIPCGTGFNNTQVLQNGGKWFDKDYNPTMPKRPACTYRNWQKVIKQDRDDLIIVRKEYNCTIGTKPFIQEICNFFDFNWLCLSDRDRKNEDRWTKKEWQDLPSTHPCKFIARSLSTHSSCSSNATNVLLLW